MKLCNCENMKLWKYGNSVALAFIASLCLSSAFCQDMHISEPLGFSDKNIPEERLEARQAFSELKFGIFLHWGIYSGIS